MKQLAYALILLGAVALCGPRAKASTPTSGAATATANKTVASADAAPQASVEAILARSKATSGGAAWDHIHTMRTKGTLKLAGLSGTATVLQDLFTGRSVARATLGPIHISNGFDGEIGWSKSPNGNVSTSDTSAVKKADATSAYQTEKAWWYPKRWPAKITSLGIKKDQGVTFQVLRITPRGGNSFEMWINAETHLIKRFVSQSGSTTYLSDYHAVDGVKIAFHRRTSSGERQIVTQYKTISVNVPVSDADFAVPGQHLNDFSFIDGGNTATIPFKLVDNHIHIRVKVDGHPLHFVLDSGSRNVLTPQAAKAAGVKAKGALQGVGVGASGGKTVSAGFSKVQSLVLSGKVALRNQTFFVIPLPDFHTTIPLDGTVGYGVFKRFVVRIDYANHLLTLIRPEKFDPEGAGVPVPLKFNGDKVAVKGSIDDLPGHFEIDTGNAGSLLLYTPFSKANNLYTRYRATPPVVGGGFAGVVHRRVARAGELTIGSVTVKGPIMELSMARRGATADKNFAGNIGARILQRFTVTFDYANKLMYLKPNENYGKPMNYDRSGMKVKGTNRGFKVMGVMQRGPAAQADIKAGDVITAVNGEPTRQADPFAFMQMLRNEAPGTQVKLTVGKGDAAHDVSITLRRLIPKHD